MTAVRVVTDVELGTLDVFFSRRAARRLATRMNTLPGGDPERPVEWVARRRGWRWAVVALPVRRGGRLDRRLDRAYDEVVKEMREDVHLAMRELDRRASEGPFWTRVDEVRRDSRRYDDADEL